VFHCKSLYVSAALIWRAQEAGPFASWQWLSAVSVVDPAACVNQPSQCVRQNARSVCSAVLATPGLALQRAGHVVARGCNQGVQLVGCVSGCQQFEDVAAAAATRKGHGGYGITSHAGAEGFERAVVIKRQYGRLLFARTRFPSAVRTARADRFACVYDALRVAASDDYGAKPRSASTSGSTSCGPRRMTAKSRLFFLFSLPVNQTFPNAAASRSKTAVR